MSDRSWEIAESLLFSDKPILNFFAAQTLYVKLSKNIEDSKITTSLIGLRDNIMRLVLLLYSLA